MKKYILRDKSLRNPYEGKQFISVEILRDYLIRNGIKLSREEYSVLLCETEGSAGNIHFIYGIFESDIKFLNHYFNYKKW